MRVTARGYRISLGCSSQAYKACICPASRLKTDLRVRNRNASGLRMRELTCLKQGPEAVPHGVRQKIGRRGPGATFTPEGKGRLPVTGELGSLVTRETSKGHTPHCPFAKNNHQLGPGASR